MMRCVGRESGSGRSQADSAFCNVTGKGLCNGDMAGPVQVRFRPGSDPVARMQKKETAIAASFT